MSLYDAIPEEIDGYSRYSSCLRKAGEQKSLHTYFCPFCFHWHVGGCNPGDDYMITIIEGMPMRHISTRKGWEDTKRYCKSLTSQGYIVRHKKLGKRNKSRFQVYVYKTQGVTA